MKNGSQLKQSKKGGVVRKTVVLPWDVFQQGQEMARADGRTFSNWVARRLAEFAAEKTSRP